MPYSWRPSYSDLVLQVHLAGVTCPGIQKVVMIEQHMANIIRTHDLLVCLSNCLSACISVFVSLCLCVWLSVFLSNPMNGCLKTNWKLFFTCLDQTWGFQTFPGGYIQSCSRRMNLPSEVAKSFKETRQVGYHKAKSQNHPPSPGPQRNGFLVIFKRV